MLATIRDLDLNRSHRPTSFAFRRPDSDCTAIVQWFEITPGQRCALGITLYLRRGLKLGLSRLVAVRLRAATAYIGVSHCPLKLR